MVTEQDQALAAEVYRLAEELASATGRAFAAGLEVELQIDRLFTDDHTPPRMIRFNVRVTRRIVPQAKG